MRLSSLGLKFLLWLKFLDADLTIHELSPLGLETNTAHGEGDFFSVFVVLNEVSDLVDDFAVEDEDGFFGAVDLDFHLVPLAEGLLLAEFGGESFSGSFLTLSMKVAVLPLGVDFEALS